MTDAMYVCGREFVAPVDAAAAHAVADQAAAHGRE